MNSAVVKDIFFLDIQDAYSEAAKQQSIIDADGLERLQYCYYDGLLTDIVLPNFIQVTADKFVEFFSHNQLPVPQLIAVSQDGVVHFNDMPVDVIDEVMLYRRQYRVPEYVHFDTYFVDPLQALNVAKQCNRVNCGHPTIDGLQICYYRGELPEHGFENLIRLELSDFEDFFVRSRLRMPENIEIPEQLEDEVKVAVKQDIASVSDAVKRKRLALMQQLLSKAKALQPRMIGKRPPRIFIPSSRLTTVMQYSSQGIAKAFTGLGWEVLFYIEANDMEGSNMVDMLEKYIDFDPHACFYVNSLNNSFMHEDVVNLVWWQDLMPQLKERQPLRWRVRDFNFSISPFFDRYLEQCQAASIGRMHFVIDDEVFHNGSDVVRLDKIVFVGSSYLPVVNPDDGQHKQALERLIAVMGGGGRFDETTVMQIAEASGLNYEFVFWKLLHYVIRDYSVKWLCANPGLSVDVYGRYWDQDFDIAPYYRGELKHGQAVADVYRSVRYALVCHPFEINSQRLAEVAACGCIPVMYDCRDVAEPPFWDEYCLFFKTAEDLQNILHQRLQPIKAPEGLAAQFTYRAAVKQLIDFTDIYRLINAGGLPNPEPITVLPELCGENLLLCSGLESVRQSFQVNLQSNLACLEQYRPDLHEALLTAWRRQTITIVIDQVIAEECWKISVELNGNESYRLDNIALLDHKRLIAENATLMTRENTCCYALVGLGSGYELLAAFRATELPIAEMEAFEVPVYLVESKSELWLLNLLLHDLQPLLAAPRLRIFHDANFEAELSVEFLKFEAALPDMLFNLDPKATIDAEGIFYLSVAAKQARAEQHAINLQQVADYYCGITIEQWRQKFQPERVGELRVMGFISRFSSFLKYCMRDWMDGFDRLGATTLICSESENYYLSNIEHLIDEINRFKPDLILTIDHFRHDFVGIPEAVPFVNWIQDMLPNITGNQAALKANDFTFVFSKHWLVMNNNELYQDHPFAYLPLGYNDSYYHPLPLSGYEYDFLVITHLIEPEKTFQPIRTKRNSVWRYDDNEMSLLHNGYLTEQQLQAIYGVILDYTDSLTLNEFHAFCLDNQADRFSSVWCLLQERKPGIDITQDALNLLLAGACTRFHYDYLTIMKTRPISVLIDAGLELRMALYGRNWEKYPKFVDFAQGIAENGEVINQLMNRSKICFNGSPGTTLHMRALEIMASGAFMLSKRIYNDAAPLSEYYSDDEVAYYEDERDLVEKVEYYLGHESIRNGMAQKAYSKTVNLFSYKTIAASVLDSISGRLTNSVNNVVL